MPNRDGTGPEGKGSKTGRGMGKCEDSKKQTGDRPRDGRGQGKGRGQGLGRRNQSN